jgi:hypothetical protein
MALTISETDIGKYAKDGIYIVKAFITLYKLRTKLKVLTALMLDIANGSREVDISDVDLINIKMIFSKGTARINYNERKYINIKFEGYSIADTNERKIGLFMHTIIGLGTSMYWGINPSVFKHIVGIELIECFASPFNHYADKYFSIFRGDSAYGSIGNFFGDFANYGNDAQNDILFSINPPFTEKIIINTMKLALNKIKVSDRFVFMFYLPKWDDLFYTDQKKYKTCLMEMFAEYTIAQKHLTDTVYDFQLKKNIQMRGFSIRVFIIYKNKKFDNLAKLLMDRL